MEEGKMPPNKEVAIAKMEMLKTVYPEKIDEIESIITRIDEIDSSTDYKLISSISSDILIKEGFFINDDTKEAYNYLNSYFTLRVGQEMKI